MVVRARLSLSLSLSRARLNDQQKRYENSRCVLLVLLSADVFDDALISRFFSSIFVRSSSTLVSLFVMFRNKSRAFLDASLLLLVVVLLSADVFDLLIQFVDFSVLLFDFRSVFFDASLRVEERLLDESGIGLLHVRETLDAKVLHDLFDLLLQVEHFGLEFCSLQLSDDGR